MIFDHPDELGSATTATDCTGKNVQERLYYPFGEFWNGAGSLGKHQTFAQLPDYDPETDQYNTANRHYSPSGRWMSPDPGGLKVIHLDDPQTWNMYAHARNNSTTDVDPDGEDYYLLGGEGCGQNGVTCDQQGYVLDQSGNRQVVTDQQVLNGDVGISSGLNDTTWLTTAQGTFEGQFFDYLPISIDVTAAPGSALAAVGANLGIGVWNEIADFGNSFTTSLTFGQDTLNLPNVPGGLGYAAISGQALAMLLPAVAGDEEPTPGQLAQAENVLLTKGRGAVMKAIRSFERLIAEHEDKIGNATGYTSSMERELVNLRQLLQAYRQVLGR
jgi:RHS repeat-associated protein